MEPFKITVTLLEHYLLAAGWRLSHGLWIGPCPNTDIPITVLNSIDTEYSMIGLILTRMGRPLGRSEIATAAALGLCAAAESLRTQAHTEHDPVGGYAAVLYGAAERLLRMAGIDPERWEEARRG